MLPIFQERAEYALIRDETIWKRFHELFGGFPHIDNKVDLVTQLLKIRINDETYSTEGKNY